MTHVSRRALVAGSASVAGAALVDRATAFAETTPWRPEKGARLTLLRWKNAIAAEQDAFVALLDAFAQATGTQVGVTWASLDDIAAKATLAAEAGEGPDLVWGLYGLPHLVAQKCVDVTDLAEYLGRRYGGWAPSAAAYGKSLNRWIAIPVCYVGSLISYRVSSLQKAGFLTFPSTTDEFLEYARATRANNTPGGFALGHAASDGNAWVYWCLWAFGGSMADQNDRVTIGSAETEKALTYAKDLYDLMVPGVTNWNDGSNNKAFLAGQIHWTDNGLSIYAAARRDPALQIVANDTNHAYYPVGPVGRPTELHLMLPLVTLAHTKYPKACKALVAFLLEADHYNRWIEAAEGDLSPALGAYETNPIWSSDPKRTLFRNIARRSMTIGGVGAVGAKSATALAEFVLLDMFANCCTGRESPKGAMTIADRHLQRIYR